MTTHSKLTKRRARTCAEDDQKQHRIRVIAYCLRAGRKPPTGMTKEEHEAALKLLEALDADYCTSLRDVGADRKA